MSRARERPLPAKMPFEPTFLLLLLGIAVVLFVTGWLSMEVTSIGIIVALAVSGILEPNEALSGFSSPATITVVGMLVLSAGLDRAGIVDYAARVLSMGTRAGLRGLLVVLAIPAIGFSAFMNNTPVVALMIPIALTLARKARVAPSRILLPLSYFSILGGTCTLFGTSTNILVDALYKEGGGPGFAVFEFAPLGMIFVAVGMGYVLLLAPRTLPDRTAMADLLAVQAPGRFVTEIVLREGSRYLGKRLSEAFPEDQDVNTLQLVRGEEALLQPHPELQLQAGDVLFVESTARNLNHLFSDPEWEPGTAVADAERVEVHTMLSGEIPAAQDALSTTDPKETERIHAVDLRMAEAVLTPTSRFLDRRVRDLGLNRKHNIQVLALRRRGRQHQYQLRELRLSAGDVLLVQGEPDALRQINDDGDFLLIEGVESTLTFPHKAPIAAAILVGVVMAATLGLAPIVFLALAGIGLMLATKCLDVRAAVRAIEPRILLLLASTIPLGYAISKVGLAEKAATELVRWVGTENPWLLIGTLYLLTNFMTELLSNNATAVLLAPIALSLSAQLGVDAKPLLIAIAFGASASFSTPIGYQTNTLVMGPGGYRVTDYIRFGLPLNIIMAIAATFLIPVLWPL